MVARVDSAGACGTLVRRADAAEETEVNGIRALGPAMIGQNIA